MIIVFLIIWGVCILIVEKVVVVWEGVYEKKNLNKIIEIKNGF